MCALPSRDATSDDFSYFPHRPCLALAAVFGAIIGLAPRRVDGRTTLNNDGTARTVLATSIHLSLSKSLTSFGLMNIVGLLHHCILPPPGSYENAHPSRKYIDDGLRIADYVFTGISSAHLVIMAILMYKRFSRNKDAESLKYSTKRLALLVYGYLMFIIIATPMIFQLIFKGHIEAVVAASASLEAIYLLPLVAAAIRLLPVALLLSIGSNVLVASRTCNKNMILGARIAILGGAGVIADVVVDVPRCHFVSTYLPNIQSSLLLNDIYQLGTLVFLGCDIAFLGVIMMANGVVSELTSRNEKQH